MAFLEANYCGKPVVGGNSGGIPDSVEDGKTGFLVNPIDPADVARARVAVQTWREYRPQVDLYVAPVVGVELPPVDCDELDVRIPLTAFLRPFNVLGWAALAIGDLQLVAPSDEVVLAAGLAWERGT